MSTSYLINFFIPFLPSTVQPPLVRVFRLLYLFSYIVKSKLLTNYIFYGLDDYPLLKLGKLSSKVIPGNFF